MSASHNPLLNSDNLPSFEGVQASHIEPAIAHLISLNEKTLLEVLSHKGDEYTWESLVVPLDEAEDKLEKAWSIVSHLNSVANTDDIRTAYESSQAKLTAYYSALGQNTQLYNAYLSLQREEYKKTLNQAQKKAIENAIRSFKLSGVALNKPDKKRFSDIDQTLSSLTTQFANNVLDATQGWYTHITDENELSGIPDLAKQSAKNAAEKKELEGWVFTLDIPSYLAVLTYADSQSLRKSMYTAYVTRASELCDLSDDEKAQLNNTQLIDQILALRQEKSKLLGFDNYAQLSIEPKMAKDTKSVIAFLEDLAKKSKPQAVVERKALEAFAKNKFAATELNAWDTAYYSEKLKEELFNVSQEKTRQYFPLNKVLEGMFNLVGHLFNVGIEKSKNLSVYHEDVLAYDVKRDEKIIAQFYLDAFTRDKKRGGAWMANARGKKIMHGQTQTPVAFLTCNFSPPVGDTPSLLTHNDVTTLFHEFGHGLHHMLTQVDVPAVGGINGVAWDAVELPSQFMENFCWEKSILPSISGHYQIQEPLPEDMLDNMIAGKNFQSAMQMVRQLEFSLFDFVVHQSFGADHFEGVQHCLDTIRKDVSVQIPPSFNKFQNGFTHIFAGGYAAGYYSYKWAEVLSADAFSAFEEEGITNQSTGERFLECILEKGGSQDAMELFKAFRGREPSTEALLEHSGIKAA